MKSYHNNFIWTLLRCYMSYSYRFVFNWITNHIHFHYFQSLTWLSIASNYYCNYWYTMSCHDSYDWIIFLANASVSQCTVVMFCHVVIYMQAYLFCPQFCVVFTVYIYTSKAWLFILRTSYCNCVSYWGVISIKNLINFMEILKIFQGPFSSQ